MRRARALLAILALGLVSAGPLTACASSDGPTGSANCCRVCRTGKACGDTCIDRSATCHTTGGCACNG